MTQDNKQELILDTAGDGFGNSSLAATLHKAEIDQQISTARAFPRSWRDVEKAIQSLATMDVETAKGCTYRKPQGKDKDGKQLYVEGASIRFAEIVAAMYGNCRQGARVIDVNRKEKTVTAQGAFHDLERNSLTVKEVTRSIRTKSGGIYSDDMIVMAGNAACSIALRNAILAGVPEAVRKKGYEDAKKLVRGDINSLAERRMNAVKAFGELGIKPQQVYDVIGVKGLEDVQLDELMVIGGIYSGIQGGDTTVEAVFYPPKEEAKPKAQTIQPDPEDDVNAKPVKKAEPTPEPTAETQPSLGLDADQEDDLETEEPLPPHNPETGEILEEKPAPKPKGKAAPMGTYSERIVHEIHGVESGSQLEAYLLKLFKTKDFRDLNDLDGQGPIFDAATNHPAWTSVPDGFARAKIVSGY